MSQPDLTDKAINTIRFLAADTVQKANSGHPGLPMALAPLAYTLFTRHMCYNPNDPEWPNRDRFILSAGHGSALLYAILHLTGYDLPMEQLKRFRQLGSHTPGHPEYGEAPGIETTTGPLGQGFANGVGMAVAQAHLAAEFNRDGFQLFDHNIYAIVSDGDLMEGVASEAASLAGHLKLGRLIYLYDDNHISIDGSTEITFTEDRIKRFSAYGWHVSEVADVNDLEAVDAAIREAKKSPLPSLVSIRSRIGYGLPTKENTASAHGEPPGEEELAGAKKKLGWPLEPSFLVPEDVRQFFADAVERNRGTYAKWQELFAAYREKYPDLAAELERRLRKALPANLEDRVEKFPADQKGMATRASSGKVLNDLAGGLPELIGGSADLTGSNKTDIKGEAPFSVDHPAGRYIHFGVREHAMGSMLNGMALYGGLIPYGGTFLVFSDYMRPAIRLAAMMKQRVVYVFTHDSIGLGEDGPTHQPIEQLAALRAIPNLTVIRPADANEVAQAWLVAIERTDGPTALALTRQGVPTIDREKYGAASSLRKGAYVLADLGKKSPEVILMASGSEVALIIEAANRLVEQGSSVRVISFPSWELFSDQTAGYQAEVLPPGIRARVSVEAGVSQGWKKWTGDEGIVIGIDRYGVSAPYKEAYEFLGVTVDKIVRAAQDLINGGVG